LLGIVEAGLIAVYMCSIDAEKKRLPGISIYACVHIEGFDSIIRKHCFGLLYHFIHNFSG
jgi:hypothetical protein